MLRERLGRVGMGWDGVEFCFAVRSSTAYWMWIAVRGVLLGSLPWWMMDWTGIEIQYFEEKEKCSDWDRDHRIDLLSSVLFDWMWPCEESFLLLLCMIAEL